MNKNYKLTFKQGKGYIPISENSSSFSKGSKAVLSNHKPSKESGVLNKLFSINPALSIIVSSAIFCMPINLHAVNGVNLGSNTEATGPRSLAIGAGGDSNNKTIARSTDVGGQALAIGNGSQALVDQATAIGNDTKANAWGAIAIGGDDLKENKKQEGVSIKDEYISTLADGKGSVAIGALSTAKSDKSIALGAYATATGVSSLAMMWGSKTGEFGMTSCDGGRQCVSGVTNSATNAIAIGVEAWGKKDNTIALGTSTQANEVNAIAIGNGAIVNSANSVAIGSDSVAGIKNNINYTNGDNENTGSSNAGYYKIKGAQAQLVSGINNGVSVFSVGASGKERQIQNVAAGKVSADSTDAINGSQLYATAATLKDYSDKIGWKISDGGNNNAEITNKLTTDGDYKTITFTGSGATSVTLNPDSKTFTISTPTATVNNNNGTFSVNNGDDNKPVTAGSVVTNLNALKNLGLTFGADTGGTTKQALGSTLNINAGTSDTGYAGTNLRTKVESGKILIGMKETPSFNSITLGNVSNKGNLTFDENGLKIDGQEVGNLHYVSIKGTETGTGSNYQNDGASGANAIAIGVKAKSTSNKSVAIGNDIDIQADNIIALGSGIKVDGLEHAYAGGRWQTKSIDAILIGNEAGKLHSKLYNNGELKQGAIDITDIRKDTQVGPYSISMGTNSLAAGEFSMAIGSSTIAQGNRSMAIGNNNLAGNTQDIASTQTKTQVYGEQSIGIGTGILVTAKQSVALGNDLKVFGVGAIGIGGDDSGINNYWPPTVANGDGSVAIGTHSQAIGKNSLALGADARAGMTSDTPETNTKKQLTITSGEYALAIMAKSEAKKDKSIAIGYQSISNNERAIAIGNDSVASLDDSIAIGSNSKATTLNTNGNFVYMPDGSTSNQSVAASPNGSGISVFSVGSDTIKRQIQNVAAGRVSADSTDAINGSQLHYTALNLKEYSDANKWIIAGNDGNEVNKIGKDNKVQFINGTGTTASVIKDTTTNDTKVTFNINKALVPLITNGSFAGTRAENTFYDAPAIDSMLQNIGWKVSGKDSTNTAQSNLITTGKEVEFVAGDNAKVEVDKETNGKTTIKISSIIPKVETVTLEDDTAKNDGSIVTPNENDKNKFVTAGNLAKTINNSLGEVRNLGIDFSADNFTDTDDTTKVHKNLGEKLEILSDDIETDYKKANLKTAVKDGKVVIGFKDKPIFSEVTADKFIAGGVVISKDNGINAGGKAITNVGTPTNDNDAVNKGYVDNHKWIIAGNDGNEVNKIGKDNKVQFINGTGTTANVANDNGTTKVTFNVNVANKPNIGTDGIIPTNTNGKNTFYDAPTIDSMLNAIGWNISGANDKNKHLITTGKQVEFVAGDNTSVEVSAEKDNKTTVKISSSTPTTALSDDTSTNNGNILIPTQGDENKFVTAGNLAKTINNSLGEVRNLGLDFTADINGTDPNNKVHRNLGESLAIKSGDITDIANGNKEYKAKNLKTQINTTNNSIEIGISDKPEFSEVKADKFKTGNDANSPSMSKDGIDAGGEKITNVGDPKNDTDATNKSYVDTAVKDAVGNSKWKIKNNSGAEVAEIGKDNVVDFVNGVGTTAEVEKTNDGAKVKFSVNKALVPLITNGSFANGTRVADTFYDAPTIDSMLNAIGWNISGANDKNKHLITTGKHVEFKSGSENTIKVDVSNDNNGKTTVEVKTETAILTNETDGKIKAPKDDENKLVTAGNMAETVNKGLDALKNQGLNFSADDYVENDKNTIVNKKLGERLEIKSGEITKDNTIYKGDNLATSVKDGKIVIGFKDKPIFSEVTAKDDKGSTTINGNSINGKDGQDAKTSGIEFKENEIALKGKDDDSPVKITNVADGVNDNDAINKKQFDDGIKKLENLAAAAKTEVVSDDSSVNITEKQGDNKQTIYDLSVNKATLNISPDGKNITSDKKDNAFVTGENVANIVNKATASARTEVIAGKNVDVIASNGADGHDIYDINVSGDLTEISSIANGATKISLDKDKNEVNINNAKITNVTDGDISETSKDAINGSQIHALKNELNKNINAAKTEVVSNDGSVNIKEQLGKNNQTIYDLSVVKSELTISSDGKTITSNTPNNAFVTGDNVANIVNKAAASARTELENGKNTTVSKRVENSDGHDIYKVDVKGDLEEISSIANGDTKISLDKDKNEINVNNAKITNIANGDIKEGSKDAVTGGQLFDEAKKLDDKINNSVAELDKKVTAAKTEVTGTGAAIVTETKGTNQQTIYNVHVDKPIQFTTADGTQVTKVGNKFYKIKKDGKPDETSEVNPKDIIVSMVNPDSTSTTPTKLTNLDKGKIDNNSKDAINGSQLKDLGDKLGLSVNDSGDGFKAPTFNNVLKDEKGNDKQPASPQTVTKAIDDIIDIVNKGLNFAGNTGNGTQNLGSSVNIVGSVKDNNSTYSSNNITTTYVKDSASGNGTITIEMKENPTFAGSVTSKEGFVVENGPSMTKDGINAGDKKITNVANGTNPNDAANISQIKDVVNTLILGASYDPNYGVIDIDDKGDVHIKENVNIGGTGQNNVNDAIAAIHAGNMRLNDMVNKNKRAAEAGIANALAVGNLPQSTIPGKGMLSIGYGAYKGQSAAALGVSKMSDSGKWVFKGAMSYDAQKSMGAAASVGFHW